MSFSSNVKEELNKFDNYNEPILKSELIGFLIGANAVEHEDFYEYITENEFNVEHFYKILYNLKIEYEPDVRGKCFVTKVMKNEYLMGVMANYQNIENEKYVVKGAFLGAGYINDPDKNYHLEIVFSNEMYSEFIYELCEKFDIHLKKLYSDEKYQLYIKESEEISRFLAFIGANKSVLNFEDVRVMKEMKNSINRKVNCETANLNKTINASIMQIEDINLIKQKKMFDTLSKDLQIIADLRVENPELSLKDLGKLVEPELGKSGVNSRLKRIHEIAEGLR